MNRPIILWGDFFFSKASFPMILQNSQIRTITEDPAVIHLCFIHRWTTYLGGHNESVLYNGSLFPIKWLPPKMYNTVWTFIGVYKHLYMPSLSKVRDNFSLHKQRHLLQFITQLFWPRAQEHAVPPKIKQCTSRSEALGNPALYILFRSKVTAAVNVPRFVVTKTVSLLQPRCWL